MLFINKSFAFDDDLRKSLDRMFEKLDRTTVPTGLLRDYAVEEEDLDLFNGKSPLQNKNCVTGIQFMGLVNTINSADISGNSGIKNFKQEVTNYHYETNEIPLSILLYQYSQIKADALNNGLITYIDGQVERVPDTPSPYQYEYVFAVCGLNRKLTTRDVVFSIPSSLMFSNCDITEVGIDCGNGYKTFGANDKIRMHLNTGINNIKMYITLKNGQRLHAHTNVLTENINQSRNSSSDKFKPDEELTIGGDSYFGITTTATVSIHLGSEWGVKHTSISKPIIIVEGFDPRCLNPTERGSWNDSRLMSNYIIQDLNSYYGYDIIYVDWDKSEEYIQANANVLTNIIKIINNRKDLNDSHNNIIIGHSMGGLIARYALKKMEDSSISHQVDTYISYDVPHNGAHIPLGILYGFNGLLKFIDEYGLLTKMTEMFTDIDIQNIIKLGEKIAYSTAAQQMLVNHIDPAGIFNNDEHKLWQKELNELGFPKGDPGHPLKMLAVAHGSYNQVTMPYHYLFTSFKVQSDVFQLTALGPSIIGIFLHNVMATLLTCLPGRTTIEGEVELYPARGYDQKIAHLKLKYKKKFLWLISIKKDLFSYDRNFPKTTNYDSYPSSTYGLPQFKSNLGELKSDTAGNFGLYTLLWGNFDCDIAPEIPFIPTSSALSIGDGININPADYLNPPTIGTSPFGENYYISKSPESHTDFSFDALRWIVTRITQTLDGPVVGVTGSKYRISNYWGNITWSTSDPSIATIDSQGILTAKGKGIISIIATNENGDKYSKSIMVGMPRFVLSGQHVPGGYKVTARCIDNEFSNKLHLLNGAIKYNWGIKYPAKDILWDKNDYSEILVPLKDAQDNVGVYFQITDMQGSESPIHSITCDVKKIYYSTSDKFYMDANGGMYTSDKSETDYDFARVYLYYVNDLEDKYFDRDWMLTSAKVYGPMSNPHVAPVNARGILVRDIVTNDEFTYMKTASTDGDSYTFLLVLRNPEEDSIQLMPITFSYSTNI